MSLRTKTLSRNCNTYSLLCEFCMQQYQQQKNSQNVNRHYTQEQLPMHRDGFRLEQVQDPWQMQVKYQKESKQMQPTQAISGVKNEMYIHKDSLKLVPSGGPDQAEYSLQFNYTSQHPCNIVIYQGSFLKVTQGDPIVVNITPVKGTAFEEIPPPSLQVGAAPDAQAFPGSLARVNIGYFFLKSGKQGDTDITKATGNYYPLIVYMRGDYYQSIFCMQLQYQRGSLSWAPQLLRQMVIVNGQLFELTEAYGLKSGRTDDDGTQECVICLTNQKNTIARPCKHCSLCSSCAQVVFNSDRKCPVCRQIIEEIIPIKVVV